MSPVLRLRIAIRRFRRPPCETVPCPACRAAGRTRLEQRQAWHAARTDNTVYLLLRPWRWFR